MKNEDIILETKNLFLNYGDKQALKEVSLKVYKNNVTALIGPSGCGKSTLLRCFNRLNDLLDNCQIKGEVLYHDKNLYSQGIDVVQMRRRIGMVFQKPNPFPKSIYENVAYGPRVHGVKDKKTLDEIVKRSLKKAALWDEVHERLFDNAMSLSGGQQQRLCIARTLAVEVPAALRWPCRRRARSRGAPHG